MLYFVGDANCPTVTREGLTRDLEAMKEQGLGGVVFFYGWVFRDPDGSGHWQNEPGWWDTMGFAIREARRVGLQVMLFNSPIWNSGGPWVKPADAMKEFSWSRVEVEGPKHISMALPPLPQREGFSRDAFVVAYPTPGTGRISRMQAAGPDVTSSPHEAGGKPGESRQAGDMVDAENPLGALFDGNYLTSVTLKSDGGPFIEYAFKEPFACDSLYLQLDRQQGKVEVELQAENEKGEPVSCHRFSMDAPGAAEGKAPVEPRKETFEPIKAKRFRIVFKPSGGKYIRVAEAGLLNHDEIASAESFIPFFRAQSATRPPFSPAAFDKDRLAKPLPGWIVPGDKVINLTAQVKDGKLDWDAPAGKWTILRFGYTLTGIRIVPGWAVAHMGEGLEVDRLDRGAVERHFNAFIAKFLDDPALKGAIQSIEEDSWEVHWQTWSAAFPDEFRARRNYDLVKWLPALTGEVVDTPDATRLFLHDFRRTIGDLIADNFYGTYHELTNRRGVQFHAEAAGPRVEKFAPTDPLQFKGRTDVPMGEFHSFVTDKIIQPDIKEAASAAHLYGQNIAAAEAFTGPDDFRKDPFAIKALGDRAFCEGINHFYLHVYTHKPDERKPGPIMATLWGVGFNRHQTWWPMAHGLFDYFARCQYLLRQGLFVGDLLYYYGENVPAFAWPELRHLPPPPGYDYDWCNTELLLNRLSVKDGRIVAPNGTSYRALVLPEEAITGEQVRQKLAELAKAGAWIIGPDSDKPLADLLAEKNIAPDFTFKSATEIPELLFIHRIAEGADLYFLSNQGGATGRVECSFRVTDKQPELWDPVTGAIRELGDCRIENGRTILPVEFAPEQSFFVVFRKGIRPPGTKTANFPPLETIQELSGAWEVSFDPKWGGPEKVEFSRLSDWIQRAEPGIKYYSGIAVYRKTFDFPVGKSESGKILLDLGRVRSLAEVRLNGQDLGVVWCAPWQVDVGGAIKPGTNELEIKVANVWINRLLYDRQLPEAERITWTNANKQNFANSTPVESGLLGPVTLRTLQGFPEK